KKEIAKITKQSSDAGFTIVPLKVFITSEGYR
ncbi:MAG: SsrA-binding protein, partial [Muribaculaceae bacterium]|nr:SsrA-binding protein [Muribaculaceae bacterium]